MLLQCTPDALASADGGFAADAGVDYPVLRMAVLQFLLQQGNPGFFARHAVTGGQAVAKYQDGRPDGMRGAWLPQRGEQQENRKQDGAFHDGDCAGS